jgi:hypothetical protein
MGLVAAIHTILGALLLLVSPVAAERGYVLMAWLVAVGGLAVWGGKQLWDGRRKGLWAAMGAQLLSGIPGLWLTVDILSDLAAHRASLDSSGHFFFLLALVPALLLAALWRMRGQLR